MSGSAGSLSAALAAADSNVTVLDDRLDAEDHAAFLWMRAHRLPGNTHHAVIGTEHLPGGWFAKTKKFSSEVGARSYLHGFLRNHNAAQTFQVLARTLSVGTHGPFSDSDALGLIAANLINGRAWLIELPKRDMKSRFVSKTSPSAFAPLNPRLGTKVDFTFIAGLEGDQWLRGYVPMSKGIVAGRSGMTVASGFDLGQWKPEELQSFGYPPALMNKIKFFAWPNNFKGLNKAQVAAKVGKLGPVPELTKPEADLCDGTVFGKILGNAKNLWDASHRLGVPDFTALPGGWQTVWLSRNYQEGPNPKNAQAIAFRRIAVAGQWQQAIAALRSYSQYTDRANREADLLAKELPAPIDPAAGPAK